MVKYSHNCDKESERNLLWSLEWTNNQSGSSIVVDVVIGPIEKRNHSISKSDQEP